MQNFIIALLPAICVGLKQAAEPAKQFELATNSLKRDEYRDYDNVDKECSDAAQAALDANLQNQDYFVMDDCYPFAATKYYKDLVQWHKENPLSLPSDDEIADQWMLLGDKVADVREEYFDLDSENAECAEALWAVLAANGMDWSYVEMYDCYAFSATKYYTDMNPPARDNYRDYNTQNNECSYAVFSALNANGFQDIITMDDCIPFAATKYYQDLEQWYTNSNGILWGQNVEVVDLDVLHGEELATQHEEFQDWDSMDNECDEAVFAVLAANNWDWDVIQMGDCYPFDATAYYKARAADI